MNREKLIQAIIESLYKIQRPNLKPSWREYGLSHAQVGMLYLLHYHGDTSVKESADFLGVTKSAITQLLDPLVDKDLVSRASDSRDRRIVRLNLTNKGKAVLKKLAKHKLAGLRSALEKLDAEELNQLQRLYKKMEDI